jgi:D-lactate dehydrogenase
MFTTAVFDAKPYDRDYLGRTGLPFQFLEGRLDPRSALAARGCQAVCLFVNDAADARALRVLKAQGVRHLALRCAGFNNLDLEASRALGLTVSRVPAYSPHAVAEHTVALVLALNRHLARAYRRVLEHDFRLQGLLGWDLHGKTVGIVGTGRIGRLTAQIFRGFGCAVLASDPYPRKSWARAHGVRYAPLAPLLKASDVVSLHAPLTPQSFHLIDAQALARMKPTAYIVNTSRGKLVDTKALIAALKARRLGGVALDVYEEEEGVFFEDKSDDAMQDDQLARLLTFPNVLMTSHQAYFTAEALTEIARVTAENLKRVDQGKPVLKGTAL